MINASYALSNVLVYIADNMFSAFSVFLRLQTYGS